MGSIGSFEWRESVNVNDSKNGSVILRSAPTDSHSSSSQCTRLDVFSRIGMHSGSNIVFKVREVNCAQDKTTFAAASEAPRVIEPGDIPGDCQMPNLCSGAEALRHQCGGESRYAERPRVKYSQRAQ